MSWILFAIFYLPNFCLHKNFDTIIISQTFFYVEINLLAPGYGKLATQSETDRPASYDRYARNLHRSWHHPFSAQRMTFWLCLMHPRSSNASRPWRTTRGRSNSRACWGRRRRRRRFRYPSFVPCSTFSSISVDIKEKCHPLYDHLCICA